MGCNGPPPGYMGQIKRPPSKWDRVAEVFWTLVAIGFVGVMLLGAWAGANKPPTPPQVWEVKASTGETYRLETQSPPVSWFGLLEFLDADTGAYVSLTNFEARRIQ